MQRAVRLGKALAVAVLVMILSVLPPGLHVILGPLSPLIGGFAGGIVGRLRGGEALVFGTIEAVAAGLTAGVLLPRLGHLTLGTATLWFFGIVATLYAGVLGGTAAYVGGRQAGAH
ncbi:MAG: hypothetical protein RMK01_07090 [Thermomicrobium sp.]|nr:hypothetical protein [Thermomicrobium sp.]MDW8059824.1 hypothetical protein [Thermomicrobium sp.]